MRIIISMGFPLLPPLDPREEFWACSWKILLISSAVLVASALFRGKTLISETADIWVSMA